MRITKFFKALKQIVVNPEVIDEISNDLTQMTKSFEKSEKDIAILCTENSRLQSRIEEYVQDIERGSLLQIPNMTKGDVIYYIENGSILSINLLKNTVVTVYGNKRRSIVELTVNHYRIINGLLYIVTEEDPNTPIYVQDPMLFDTFSSALKEIRAISVGDGFTSEVVTEIMNRYSVAVSPNTFTLPCRIGSSIFYIGKNDNEWYEYKVLGFNIREDDIKILAYKQDSDDIEYIDFGPNGIKDNRWGFKRPNN